MKKGRYKQLTYKNYGNYIEISKCKASVTEIVIPSEIAGLPVTTIGDYAFWDCSALISINIPDSVTSIGERAFLGCSSLTSIKIPDSVTTIGEGAFYNTPLFELKKKENPLVIINGILIDGKDCSGDVIIPDSVKIIGNDAFLNCIDLTSVTIPNGVTSIGAGAFSDCVDLISVDIPDSVTSIGDGAFRACENLIFIKIPNSVISIGDEVFAGCEKLPTTEIPDSVTSIGKFIFSCVGDLNEIKILNPECILPEFIINEEEGEGIIFDITIYGYDNSTAQTYAEKYGYKFKSLGDSPIK